MLLWRILAPIANAGSLQNWSWTLAAASCDSERAPASWRHVSRSWRVWKCISSIILNWEESITVLITETYPKISWKNIWLSVWQKLLSYFNTCISVECIVYHFDSTSLSSRSRSKACVTKGCKLSHERKEARIQTYFVWGRLNVHPISACWTGLNSVAIPLLKSQTNLLA